MIKQPSSKKNKGKYQNHSLMALASNHIEPTKKSIEFQELYNFQPTATSNNRKYIFSLPYSTQIPTVTNNLATKFAELVIHVESDSKSAQILLQGVQIKSIKRLFKRCLDYFVFCCSKGLRYGILQESYNVILITIKKQIIQNRCTISITNPYRQQDSHGIFMANILDPIQQELKIFGKQLERHADDQTFLNPYLNESSPTQLQIHIHRKIYNLFVLNEIKDLNRYKNIFLHSLEKVKREIQKSVQKLKSSNKNLIKQSNPTQSIIQQTQSLMNCLKNSYIQQQSSQNSYLHSLFISESRLQITQYTIEEVLCLYQCTNIKHFYYESNIQQCQMFNANVKFLNQEFSDQDCFEHLELRKRYTLPTEAKPYYTAIQKLKQIQYCISLRQMLLVIQQTFSQVKTNCLAAHNGKVQLSSMDDLLPVMIFVTVRASINNFPVFIKMIDDYVRFKSVFQLEERVMTTFYVAIEDISRQWQKKQKK